MVKKKREKNEKNIPLKKKKEGKTIVIGYAYLSQGKHITSELNRLVGNQSTTEQEIKQRQKRWNTNLVNQTGQIRKVRDGSGVGKQDRNGGDTSEWMG